MKNSIAGSLADFAVIYLEPIFLTPTCAVAI